MTKTGKLSFCLIVKNEEKNVEDCLRSIYDIADEIIIVDTGSKDKTKEVCSKYTDKIYDFKWIDDFSAARNFSISKATKEYICWMDGDDILLTPEKVLNAVNEGNDVYNFNILYGNESFCHARLFRNNKGIKFAGRVHEVPVFTDGLTIVQATDIDVKHKTEKHITEDRGERNYRILSKDVEEHPNDSRALFYFANNIKERGDYDKALEMYARYLKVSTWKDEKWMAQKYIGQIKMTQKKYKEAIQEFYKALEIDDRWAETYYYIGESYFLLKEYSKCIAWMVLASNMPLPETQLFIEKSIYKDSPYRYIFASYDCMGDYASANYYCEKTNELLGGNNQWLKDRSTYFRMKIHEIENDRRNCPLCGESTYEHYEKSGKYKKCTKCGLFYQIILAEKVYEGPQEGGKGPGKGHLMSDRDKEVNTNLANSLYDLIKPKTVLDIGTKYPYLLSVLKDKAEVLGIDAIEDVKKYGKELGVPTIQADFEKMDISKLRGKYDLITMIHLIEHIYNLDTTIPKILDCLTDNGTLFVRTPTPDVAGIERDLTDHHYSIHPHLFSFQSIEYFCEKFGCKIYKYFKHKGFGQSDFYLRKTKIAKRKRGKTKMIECFRQGALGDCLMTTAALRGLKEKYPNSFIRYVTHPNSVPILENNKYIDELATETASWENPILFGYPTDEGYPDKPLNRHLVKIFNECAGLPDNSLDMECTLTQEEENYGQHIQEMWGPYITIHTIAGWSPYKEWNPENWQKVIDKLFDQGYNVVQLGLTKEPLFKNVMDIRGVSIKKSISVIKYAALHLGIDSVTNHATNAVKTPAVILFGSTSPIGSGYKQNINIYKTLDCSPCYKEYQNVSVDYRGECEHKNCMKQITVKDVLNKCKLQLDKIRK